MTIRAQIRELLTADPKTAVEIAEALSMDKGRAHNHVAQLVRAERIRAQGARGGGDMYHLASSPEFIPIGRPKGSTKK